MVPLLLDSPQHVPRLIETLLGILEGFLRSSLILLCQLKPSIDSFAIFPELLILFVKSLAILDRPLVLGSQRLNVASLRRVEVLKRLPDLLRQVDHDQRAGHHENHACDQDERERTPDYLG